MIITQKYASLIKESYQTDEIDVLAWEIFLQDDIQPGCGLHLLQGVTALLADTSLPFEATQGGAGQSLEIPEWFYNAYDLLEARGVTAETVVVFMRSRVAQVAAIAAANHRKAQEG